MKHVGELETLAVTAEAAGDGSWLERETARLVVDHPALDRLVRWLWARPAAVLLPLSVVILGSLGAVIPGGDAAWFRETGRSMLGVHLWNVFSQPGLQVGPLYLVALGGTSAAAEALRLPLLFTLAGLQAALVTWLGLYTARRVARDAGAPELPVQWAVGLALVLGGLLAESVGNGHPEEIALGLLLANAARTAKSGQRTSVGLLVGLAAGIKTWGLLGIPVVLIGRRPRDVVFRGLVAGAVVVLCYAPFFAWGEVNTFSFSWGLSNGGSTLAQLGSWFGASDWDLRLIQGAAAVLVGCAVAVRRTGSPLTVVTSVIATRLLLDPLLMSYYPGPLIILVLLWVWTTDATRRSRWRFAVAGAVPVCVLVPYLIPFDVVRSLWTVAMIVVPATMLWIERVSSQQLPRIPARQHAVTSSTAAAPPEESTGRKSIQQPVIS